MVAFSARCFGNARPRVRESRTNELFQSAFTLRDKSARSDDPTAPLALDEERSVAVRENETDARFQRPAGPAAFG
jgi:hypothetical protein